MYLPCIWMKAKDGKDWKPIWKNQKAYFKDKLNAGSTFKCLCIPGFRVCFGYVACAPTFVQCPPPCCRKRRPKSEKGKLESEFNYMVAQQKKNEKNLANALLVMRQAKRSKPGSSRPSELSSSPKMQNKCFVSFQEERRGWLAKTKRNARVSGLIQSLCVVQQRRGTPTYE